MKFIILGFAASFAWIVVAVQNAMPLGQANPWEIGKDISFAGLVWFMLGYLLPKLMSNHRDERHEFLLQLDAERKSREMMKDEHLKTLQTLGSECHAVQREATDVMAETRQVLTRVADKL